MTQRLCPRCHNALQLEDDGSLVYCGHCGAPQVRLSEETREQAEQQAAAAAAASLDPDASDAPARTATGRVNDPTAVVWPGAIQCVGLAAAVAALLILLSLPLPPVSLLGFLWVLVAPIVVLGVYAARFPRTRISVGFGVRVGLLSALSISVALAAILTIAMVLARFAFHDGAYIDSLTAQDFAQMRASLLARSADTDIQTMLRWLTIPEFRTGLLLAGMGMMLGIYLVYSSLLGGLTGYMRSRRRTQS